MVTPFFFWLLLLFCFGCVFVFLLLLLFFAWGFWLLLFFAWGFWLLLIFAWGFWLLAAEGLARLAPLVEVDGADETAACLRFVEAVVAVSTGLVFFNADLRGIFWFFLSIMGDVEGLRWYKGWRDMRCSSTLALFRAFREKKTQGKKRKEKK